MRILVKHAVSPRSTIEHPTSIVVRPPETLKDGKHGRVWPWLSSFRRAFRAHGRIVAAEARKEFFVDIYYGTVTGTALRLATKLADNCSASSVHVELHDLDDFDSATFINRARESRIVVFVVATHFAGTPPPTAERFYRWLEATSRSSPDVLRGVRYSVFGVGDSSFLTFNAVGKFVDDKLSVLGGSRMHPLGLGDASRDISGAFVSWASEFIQQCTGAPAHSPERTSANVEDSPCPTLHAIDLEKLIPLRYSCRMIRAREPRENRFASARLEPPKTPFLHRGSFNDELSLHDATTAACLPPRHQFPLVDLLSTTLIKAAADSQSDVAIFRVRLIDQQLTWAAGDTLAIFPHNRHEHVVLVAAHFGYDLDAWVDVAFASGYMAAPHERLPLPTPCTIRTALTEYLELRTVSQEFLCVAASFVMDPKEQELLALLASPEGLGSFQKVISSGYKGIPDLITMVPSLKLPLDVFINVTQPMRPRFFTIASSPRSQPGEFDLAITLGRKHTSCGLAVGFFRGFVEREARKSLMMALRGFISPSHFFIPNDPSAPMIMIAHGVGVGPMRALLQDREYEQALRVASTLGKGRDRRSVLNLVLVGCATTETLVFGSDFKRWAANGHIRIHYACSAEPLFRSMHVQELVTTHLDEIASILESHPLGRLFVSGRAGMASDVRRLLVQDQQRRGDDWFERLRHRGGYVEAGHG